MYSWGISKGKNGYVFGMYGSKLSRLVLMAILVAQLPQAVWDKPERMLMESRLMKEATESFNTSKILSTSRYRILHCSSRRIGLKNDHIVSEGKQRDAINGARDSLSALT